MDSEDRFVETLKTLVRLGADVNATGVGMAFQVTPLHVAAEKGQVAAARTLVQLGADMNARAGTFRETPLDASVRFGRPEVAQALRQLEQAARTRAAGAAAAGQGSQSTAREEEDTPATPAAYCAACGITGGKLKRCSRWSTGVAVGQRQVASVGGAGGLLFLVMTSINQVYQFTIHTTPSAEWSPSVRPPVSVRVS